MPGDPSGGASPGAALAPFPEGADASAVVYASAYSQIYHGAGTTSYDLATTLSIRYADPRQSITVAAVSYYDSDGRLVREYLDAPLTLGPLASRSYVVAANDDTGGSGANFLVRWEGRVTEPLIETVMISTASSQGLSFKGDVRVVQRVGAGGKPGAHPRMERSLISKDRQRRATSGDAHRQRVVRLDPPRQHVGRLVNTEVDAAHATAEREQDGRRDDERAEPEAWQRADGGRRHLAGHEVGAGPVEPGLERERHGDATPDGATGAHRRWKDVLGGRRRVVARPAIWTTGRGRGTASLDTPLSVRAPCRPRRSIPLPRRERERAARRRAMLAAAREVFAERGYALASVEEIADRSEFGKGTLYNYFSDGKRQILRAVLDEVFDRLDALRSWTLPRTPSPSAARSAPTPSGAPSCSTATETSTASHCGRDGGSGSRPTTRVGATSSAALNGA